MKKLFLSAIACVAFAANGFASNEIINTLEAPIINQSSAISEEETTESSEEGGYKSCSTTTYGRYVTHYINQGISSVTGQPYSSVTIVYQITGQCTTCVSMGHNGIGTTTTCWGYGY